jgi:hypothetical protein
MNAPRESSPHLEPVSLADNFVDADDALMADLTNVQEPNGPVAQVQESAVRPKALHDTLDNVSNLQE